MKVFASPVPDDRLSRHISGHGGVDDPEVAGGFTVFRILADTDIDLVVVDHRSGNDVVLGTCPSQLPLGPLGVAVELPDQLPGFRNEGIDPAIAPGEDDLGLAVDNPVGWI